MDVIAEMERLENLELEAENGEADSEVYTRLMLCYLLNNDLRLAKLLWRRSPAALREDSSTLSRLWSVGRCMWRNQWQQLYQLLTADDWPSDILPSIRQLTEWSRCVDRVRERATDLVAKAYTCISLAGLQTLLGQSEEQCLQLAGQLGWQVEGAFVLPTCKSADPENALSLTDNTLSAQVAEYVSFLET